MPEGPEVAKQADKIRKHVQKCSTIIGLMWDKNSRYFPNTPRGKMIGFELVQLPLEIQEVSSRGKVIIIQCRNSQKKTIFLVSHLGMSGCWTTEKDEKSRDKHSNLWLNFGAPEGEYYRQESQLYYNDQRKFGSFSVYEDLADVWKKNGPCLLSAAKEKYQKNMINELLSSTKETWYKTLSNSRISNKPICEFLMEQKHLSGVGNYLRGECLFECKIHPNKSIGDLTREEKELLYNTILEIMYTSYLEKIRFKCYAQKTDPDGNAVETYMDAKKRRVHFVPVIQKL